MCVCTNQEGAEEDEGDKIEVCKITATPIVIGA